MSASVIAPDAKAAPSVFTARPIHAPATIGSLHRNCWAKKGKIMSSITANFFLPFEQFLIQVFTLNNLNFHQKIFTFWRNFLYCNLHNFENSVFEKHHNLKIS
jgi:hypothetical protein